MSVFSPFTSWRTSWDVAGCVGEMCMLDSAAVAASAETMMTKLARNDEDQAERQGLAEPLHLAAIHAAEWQDLAADRQAWSQLAHVFALWATRSLEAKHRS